MLSFYMILESNFLVMHWAVVLDLASCNVYIDKMNAMNQQNQFTVYNYKHRVLDSSQIVTRMLPFSLSSTRAEEGTIPCFLLLSLTSRQCFRFDTMSFPANRNRPKWQSTEIDSCQSALA